MNYLLGVDIGTSGTKTVLFDELGGTVATATETYPLSQPRNGWAEQEAKDWARAAFTNIQKVCAGVDKNAVKAIGLSGQMHGLVAMDGAGEVLCPAIIWCDNRTEEQCEYITCKVGRERLIELTMNPALPAFTAAKLMWVKQERADIYDKIRHILLPKDYIRYTLTGEYASEVSDASGTLLLDVRHRRWSREMCSLLDIPFEWLPQVYESSEITGTLSRAAAEALGLPAGIPVCGGGGDQAAGAVGNGIVRDGVFSATIGTSGVVFAHTDKPLYDPNGALQSFCHAVKGAWHVMGVTNAAGLSLQWMRNEFGAAEREIAARTGGEVYGLLLAEAKRAPAGCEGLIYLPYLMGERAPHPDAACRGVFFGLSGRHTREHMLRAVVEGVSHSLLDCLELMRSIGLKSEEIRASGGGGRSQFWRQMLSDMFMCRVSQVSSAEGPALGAALIAAAGVGIYKDVPQACEAAVKVVSQCTPDSAAGAVYAGYHGLYDDLYTMLRPGYEQLAKLVGAGQ